MSFKARAGLILLGGGGLAALLVSAAQAIRF